MGGSALNHYAASIIRRRTEQRASIVAETVLLFWYTKKPFVDRAISIGVMENGDRNDSVRNGYNKPHHSIHRAFAGHGIDTSFFDRPTGIHHVVNESPSVLIESDKKHARSLDIRNGEN